MNSLNSRIIERTLSPHIENVNQQNVDPKNSWNKLNAIKDDESRNLDDPDSPKLEAIVEAIDSPVVGFKSCRQNGNAKRPKLDNEEYESIDSGCHLMPTFQDDCDAFGRCVTTQLRQMTKIQKALAQRLISEICFRGQIQTLQMTTVLNNQSTIFQQQPQPVPVFAARQAHFSRGTADFLSVHQQGVKQQTPIPCMSNVPPAYQNYAHVQQQSELAANNVGHLEQYGSN